MRIMISGTSSGCGKTTVTLALMAKLRAAGHSIAPFKSGPDYIDPGFHFVAADAPSHNLDPFLMREESIRQVIQLGMAGREIGVIEGAMSYYDGIGPEGECSAWSLARMTDTPVLLVIDASGSATGAAATALGFCEYRAPSNIAGFIINQVGSERHYQLVRDAIQSRLGLPCVGYMRKDKNIHLESRHLGLIPAEELPDLRDRLAQTAELLVLDEEQLFKIAARAPRLETVPMRHSKRFPGFRMGVARDEAFGFYYEANLEMLRRMDMELVFFSPLRDMRLPDDLDGLYLGGGFPEIFAEMLAANESMRASVRAALEGGLRCYAECGGMMYLTEAIDGASMAGFLPFRCRMTERLQRFGYVHIRDRTDGFRFRAHEFHHSLEEGDGALEHAFDIRRATGAGTGWSGGYRKHNTLAAYPHVHFWNEEALVLRLFGLEEPKCEG